MVVFAPMFALYAALQLLFMATLVDNPVNLPVVQILGLAAPSQIHFIAGKIVSLAATEWSISPLVTLFVNGFKLMFICSGNVGSGLFTTMRLNTMSIMLQPSSAGFANGFKTVALLAVAFMVKRYYEGVKNLKFTIYAPAYNVEERILRCAKCSKKLDDIDLQAICGEQEEAASRASIEDGPECEKDATFSFTPTGGRTAITSISIGHIESSPSTANNSTPSSGLVPHFELTDIFNAPNLDRHSFEQFERFSYGLASISPALTVSESPSPLSRMSSSGSSLFRRSIRYSQCSSPGFERRASYGLITSVGDSVNRSTTVSPALRKRCAELESLLMIQRPNEAFGSPSQVSMGLTYAAPGTPLFDICLRSGPAIAVFFAAGAFTDLENVISYTRRQPNAGSSQVSEASGIFSTGSWNNAIGVRHETAESQACSFSSSGFYCFDSFTSMPAEHEGNFGVSSAGAVSANNSQQRLLPYVDPATSTALLIADKEIQRSSIQMNGSPNSPGESNDDINAIAIVAEHMMLSEGSAFRSTQAPLDLSVFGPRQHRATQFGLPNSTTAHAHSQPLRVDEGNVIVPRNVYPLVDVQHGLGLIGAAEDAHHFAETVNNNQLANLSSAASPPPATTLLSGVCVGFNVIGGDHAFFTNAFAPVAPHPSTFYQGPTLFDTTYNPLPLKIKTMVSTDGSNDINNASTQDEVAVSSKDVSTGSPSASFHVSSSPRSSPSKPLVDALKVETREGLFTLNPFKLPSFRLGEKLAAQPVQQGRHAGLSKLPIMALMRCSDSDSLRRSAILRSAQQLHPDKPEFKIKRKMLPSASPSRPPLVPSSSSDVFILRHKKRPCQLEKAYCAMEQYHLKTVVARPSASSLSQHLPGTPTPAYAGGRGWQATKKLVRAHTIEPKKGKENMY